MTKLVNAVNFLRKNGVSDSAKEFYYRLMDNYYENYFDVITTNSDKDDNPGMKNPEAHEYGSIHYSHIYTVLNMLPVEKPESSLIDYGCGKGRVIIAAATLNYKQLIGVELADTIDMAEINMKRMKHRKTSNVVLSKGDAQIYKIPSDVNIIYFCNPFRGTILQNVTNNIRASFEENPRKIYIIYFNNNHFDEIVKNQKWLRKYQQSEFIPYFACGLYETVL